LGSHASCPSPALRRARRPRHHRTRRPGRRRSAGGEGAPTACTSSSTTTATEEWPHGNTGVVVGETGVLVVDSTYLPSRARADIALIRKLTDKPVRYLAYTHWHFDHNNGGIAYRQAFPAVDVVSARDTARYIELNAVWWSRRQAAPGSSHRKTLAGSRRSSPREGREGAAPLRRAADAPSPPTWPTARESSRSWPRSKSITPNLTFVDTLDAHPRTPPGRAAQLGTRQQSGGRHGPRAGRAGAVHRRPRGAVASPLTLRLLAGELGRGAAGARCPPGEDAGPRPWAGAARPGLPAPGPGAARGVERASRGEAPGRTARSSRSSRRSRSTTSDAHLSGVDTRPPWTRTGGRRSRRWSSAPSAVSAARGEAPASHLKPEPFLPEGDAMTLRPGTSPAARLLHSAAPPIPRRTPTACSSRRGRAGRARAHHVRRADDACPRRRRSPGWTARRSRGRLLPLRQRDLAQGDRDSRRREPLGNLQRPHRAVDPAGHGTARVRGQRAARRPAPEERKVGDFYASYLDEDAVEAGARSRSARSSPRSRSCATEPRSPGRWARTCAPTSTR
jgi:hypothetical protein